MARPRLVCPLPLFQCQESFFKVESTHFAGPYQDMNAQKLLESADATRDRADLPPSFLLRRRCSSAPSTDLAADGRFGRQWLVPLPSIASSSCPLRARSSIFRSPALARGAHRTRLSAVASWRSSAVDAPTLSLGLHQLGGRKDGPRWRGVWSRLRQGQPFVVNGHLDRTRCERCDRPLAGEKRHLSGVYKKNWRPSSAIASYLGPYKLKAGVLAFAFHRHYGLRSWLHR